jgi:hypothetical protein
MKRLKIIGFTLFAQFVSNKKIKFFRTITDFTKKILVRVSLIPKIEVFFNR